MLSFVLICIAIPFGISSLMGADKVSIRDKTMVEVFANSRQAVMRRIYPSRTDSVEVRLFSKGGASQVPLIEAWDMMASNPY